MREDTMTDATTVDDNAVAAIPLSDFDVWVETQYGETVAAAGDDGIDKADAVANLAAKAKKMIEAGRLRVPIDTTARLITAVVGSVDKRSRSKTIAHIGEVAAVLAGETILNDDDPLLDAVAVIGDGKRKTWRFVNADDIATMMIVKARHAQDAATASAEFAQLAAIVLKALRHIGSDAVVGDLL